MVAFFDAWEERWSVGCGLGVGRRRFASNSDCEGRLTFVDVREVGDEA